MAEKTSNLTPKAVAAPADTIGILDSAAGNGNARSTVAGVCGRQAGSARQYDHITAKPDINATDTTARSTVVGGGGDQGTSNITGKADSANVIGASATGDTYTPGTAHYATIAGGQDNLNNQLAGTIGGGAHSRLAAAGSHGVIAGGSNHQVVGATDYATISGGTVHAIGETAAASASTIGGGHTNAISQGPDNTIGGGRNNRIESSGAAGGNTVAGGNDCDVEGSGSYGAIGGGQGNTINSTGNGNAIVGGTGNTAAGTCNVVGGQNNVAAATSVGTTVLGASNASANNYELVTGLDLLPPAGMDGGLTFGGAGSPFSGGADGDCQAISFVQFAQTTDDATPVATYNRSTTRPTVPLNCAIAGRIMVIGKRAAYGSIAAYVCDFVVTRGASGTITIEQENWTTLKDEPVVGAVPALVAAVSSLGLNVRGAAGVTINWCARFDCAMVVAA